MNDADVVCYTRAIPRLDRSTHITRGLAWEEERIRQAAPKLLAVCEALLAWYDAIRTENEEVLSERTEYVGMCEFEAILQADSDDDFFVTADDPELAAIVEQLRTAIAKARGQS